MGKRDRAILVFGVHMTKTLAGLGVRGGELLLPLCRTKRRPIAERQRRLVGSRSGSNTSSNAPLNTKREARVDDTSATPGAAKGFDDGFRDGYLAGFEYGTRKMEALIRPPSSSPPPNNKLGDGQ
ncbi:hypothetical protein GGI25_002403 [Coemansia spiralis]|uniref:Uncharacterized protein n=2 Tax=Coemansia TaxID=4863 RepID=A0A9W8KZF6_9FUNG|nr:hypothetical protein EDC05_003512 [Coemansia umbellata]KAJ2622209.1 hypothetical protein GGI26_003504 [Coemansia sp. RSA 1358]KAJ2678418.1 hypothetical protein GGI25_002403 [Coemansia spiralis]